MEPSVGVTCIQSARDLVIGLGNGCSLHQREHKSDNDAPGKIDIADDRIKIESHRFTAARSSIAIGTEDAFANRCRGSVKRLVFINEPMRNQLRNLPTMVALHMIQLHGLLRHVFKGGEIDLHDGTGIKSAYFAIIYFIGEIVSATLAL